MNIVVAPPFGKREQTKARNREMILAAAKRVFADKGYDATTVRDIIRGTDLASGTFYNYFKSKDEIAAAIASDAAERLRPMLREQRLHATDFPSYLFGILSGYFRFLVEEYSIEGPNGRRVMRPPTTHDQSPAQTDVFRDIRSAVSDRFAKELDAEADAEFVTAAITGIARNVGLQMLYRKRQDPDGAARFAADLILKGLPLKAGQ
ncbi:MAG: TetR/AcrR family transcriptional regulator [Xanthobacteraceae bacterium]